MTNQTQTTGKQAENTPEKSAIKEKTEQAQQKASEIANEAQHQAAQLTEQAKAEAKTSLESQKEMAARELHGVATALRQTSSNLRQQDQSMVAQYSNQAAERVDRLSTYLEEHELDDIINEAEDFARRQPELFIGGAFTLGLLAARFLKSSASALENDRTRLPVQTRTTPMMQTTTPNRPYGYTTASEREQTNRPRA